MSWGDQAQIKELRKEVEDLKERLRQAVVINRQLLDQIADLHDEMRVMGETEDL